MMKLQMNRSVNGTALKFVKWNRKVFFADRYNTLLTFVSLVFIYYLFYGLWGFFSDADWSVVLANRRLLLLGRLPHEDEWRIWPILWLTGVLIFMSIGAWSRPTKKELLGMAFVFLVPSLIFTTVGTWIQVFLSAVVFITSFIMVQYSVSKKPGFGVVLKKILTVVWVIILPVIFLIMLLGGGPKPTLWGGFLLNILLAAVAIVAGFPIGVLLALGRTSSLPVIKFFSTVYIEIIRGAPLIAWLMLAWFVLPNFLPSIMGIDKASVVIRAMIVLSMFTSAYLAEVVRGGIQSVPKGQTEAATAVGLSIIQSTLFIVLPQAIRVVVPAVVSTFIAIFKDTSLVFILALTDLLAVGRLIPEQDPAFFGRHLESLSVVALMFWIVSITLSYLSRKFEKTLGIGIR